MGFAGERTQVQVSPLISLCLPTRILGGWTLREG